MSEYFDFEVVLCGAEPRVWRRFLLFAEATFADLHDAIQMACDWEDDHLFAFRDRTRKEIAGRPVDGDEVMPNDRVPSAEMLKLSSFFGPRRSRKCYYEYDFGDGWIHEVTLRGRVTLPDAFLRQLTAGERAFPPEDCGGIDGYDRCATAVREQRDPWGEDIDELLEWIGDWHPDALNFAVLKKRFDRRRPDTSSRSRTARAGSAKRSKA